jgi:hypothetical protein
VKWKVNMNLGDISTRTNVCEKCNQGEGCQRSWRIAWNLLSREILKLIAWIERSKGEYKSLARVNPQVIRNSPLRKAQKE